MACSWKLYPGSSRHIRRWVEYSRHSSLPSGFLSKCDASGFLVTWKGGWEKEGPELTNPFFPSSSISGGSCKSDINPIPMDVTEISKCFSPKKYLPQMMCAEVFCNENHLWVFCLATLKWTWKPKLYVAMQKEYRATEREASPEFTL